ncbi:MAG: hypothetical protein RL139_519 [Gemmatimonadota bacterium]
MDVAEHDEPPRERGIWAPLGVLLLLSFVTTVPLFRIVLPFPAPLVVLVPLVATGAVLGWRTGGGLPLAALWTGLAGSVLWRTVQVGGAYATFTVGWTLVLCLAFGLVGARRVGTGFLAQALPALGVALVAAGVVVAVVPGGLAGAVALVGDEVGRRAIAATREWQRMVATPEWQDVMASSPAWAESSAQVERQLAIWPARVRIIFPALLALESLVVMALGWAIYHRIGRSRLGPPLSRWRELRFDDRLIWGVVAGLALVAAPVTGPLEALGWNLLVAFGVLYAWRGLGVLAWFLAPGRVMAVVWVLCTLLFWPVIGAVAVGLGLGDTWFDWRRSARRESQRSE